MRFLEFRNYLLLLLRKESKMEEDVDFKIYLEEYKKIFEDFFSVSKHYSVKLTKPLGVVVDVPKGVNQKDLEINRFIINDKELLIDGYINLTINGVSLGNISRIVRNNRKVRIYNKKILLGIFYLQAHIHIQFLITYHEKPFKFFTINYIYINGIKDKFNNKTTKDYYRIELLNKNKGNNSGQIILHSNNYNKNMQRINFYTKIFSLLEIIFDREKMDIPIFVLTEYTFLIL